MMKQFNFGYVKCSYFWSENKFAAIYLHGLNSSFTKATFVKTTFMTTTHFKKFFAFNFAILVNE